MVIRPLEGWSEVGRRVADAREAAGLTQHALAQQIGLERTALAKIESGKRGLGSLELARLANELQRPIEWFVTEAPPTVVSRRAASLQPADDLDAVVDGFARDIELLTELGSLRSREHAPVSAPPKTLGQAEKLAQAVRSEIGEPEGPILNLPAKVQSVGLHVLSIELGETRPDGAYVALDGIGTAVVNGSYDTGRRRFTLAHELGHHIFADEYATDWTLAEPTDEREKRINAFAIHFLMPRSSVARAWSGYDGRTEPRAAAIQIAADHRVSWTAACTQLQNLELVERPLADELRANRPTHAEALELGVFVVAELAPPLLSPEVVSAVLRAYRGRKIGSRRAIELLRGTLTEQELPPVDVVPLEALRGELEEAS